MQMREWWIRRFKSEVGAGVASESDDFELCSCCGQTYSTRDLQQVLPHFEHQLGLGAESIKGPLSDGDLQTPPGNVLGNVVPFRRAGKPAAGDESKAHLLRSGSSS
jgi:hypothetical protein